MDHPWPLGMRVAKTRSSEGDTHQDGDLGRICTPIPPFDLLLPHHYIGPGTSDMGLAPEHCGIYGYWVEWDDLPGIPVAIASFRLEEA